MEPARSDEAGYAPRKDAGLAGPGAGNDDEGPAVVEDRLTLGRVQVCDEGRDHILAR